MKRYWLSIVLVVLIVVSLGIFYIESSLNSLPSFTLAKLEGDEKQAAAVVVQGKFNIQMAMYGLIKQEVHMIVNGRIWSSFLVHILQQKTDWDSWLN